MCRWLARGTRRYGRVRAIETHGLFLRGVHTNQSTELICTLLTNAHISVLLLTSDAHCIGRTGTSARSNTTPKRELAEEVERAPPLQVTCNSYTSVDSDVVKALVLHQLSTRDVPRSIPMLSIHDVCRISSSYPDFRRGTGSFLSAFLRRLGMAAGTLSWLFWPSATGLNGRLLSPDTCGNDVLSSDTVRYEYVLSRRMSGYPWHVDGEGARARARGQCRVFLCEGCRHY